MFKELTSKKRFEALREYLKEAEDADPQSRVDALIKRLNNTPKTSSNEKRDDNEGDDNEGDDNEGDDNEGDDNEGDDNEDNQISIFVDSVLKKVSKEIVNNDNNDNKENADLKSELDAF